MAAELADFGIQVPFGRGNVKMICPQCGHSGQRSHPRDKSLSVFDGGNAFKCHYCGFKGSVKENGDWRDRPAKVYAKPAPLPFVPVTNKAAEFFTLRKISQAVLETYGVTEQGGAIKFPYIRDGETVNVKTRYPGKKFAMETDCELILWGLDQCLGAEQVVIVEGELDGLACATAGISHVLSVPNGASIGTMSYLESGAAIFDGCHTVVIAVDNDEPGNALAAELARRIGKEKCCRASFPDGCKDANDVLIQHGDAAVRESIGNAKPYPVEGVHWLGDYLDAALDLRRNGAVAGLSTGWRGVDSLYTVAPGQLTVLTGAPGSGKSEWLDHLMINLAMISGWTFAVYSPENHPGEEHMVKLAEKWFGKPFWPGVNPEITDGEMRSFAEWASSRFLMFDPERPTLETLIGLARTFVFRHGIRGFVIDPWNRLDQTRPAGITETEWVRDCMAALSAFARKADLHIWLIAHPRIMRKEDGAIPVPTPYDISGSAHFFNIADNCLAIQRDKTSENAPVELHIHKIRTRRFGKLGMTLLDYDRVTGRYRDVRSMP